MRKNLAALNRKLERECPTLPWCQTDPEKLGDVVVSFMYDMQGFYKRWAQKWFENFQFVYGNHNIRWHRRYDFAIDVDFLRRDSAMNKTSQTNISRVVCEALVSAIYADLPTWAPRAVDESSSRSKRKEEITSKLLEYYAYQQSLDDKFKEAATNFVVFGQTAAFVSWDYRAGTLKNVPKMKKIKAPIMTTIMQPADVGLIETPAQAVDSMGAPLYDERWEQETDEFGKPVFSQELSGDVRIEMLTPFEYQREPGSHSIDDAKWVQRLRLMDYDEYLKEYANVPGATRWFDMAKPGFEDQQMYHFAMKQFFRMFYTTPASLDQNKSYGNVFQFAGAQMRSKIMVIEHYDRPEERWPLGRKLVIANGKCTHITEPQFNLPNKSGGWHPFVECQWLTVAPASIATGPMNDVTAKNREMNTADSLIATALLRNCGSQLLVKIGSGLDPQKISGTPGEIHEVQDPMGAAHWLHDEQPISPIVEKLRTQIKDDVYEISGAQDSLRGDRSKGVTAGYALRQLQEREEKRITPARKSFERFVGLIGEKLLTCLKANVTKLGDNAMNYILASAAGKFTSNDVLGFMGGLNFGIDVRVEAGSMAAKSKATMQASLMDLAKGPLGNRLANDANVLDKFLKFFDAETLRDVSAIHRERAQRENTVLLEMIRTGIQDDGASMPIVLFEDDDEIHIQEHSAAFVENSEEIQKNEILLKTYIIHMERHRLQQKEKNGELPPGTSQYVPSFAAGAGMSVPPKEQLVAEKQQNDVQKQAPQPVPPPPPQQPKPTQNQQAPMAPKTVNGQNKGTDPNAPAANTSQARQSTAIVEGKTR